MAALGAVWTLTLKRRAHGNIRSCCGYPDGRTVFVSSGRLEDEDAHAVAVMYQRPPARLQHRRSGKRKSRLKEGREDVLISGHVTQYDTLAWRV